MFIGLKVGLTFETNGPSVRLIDLRISQASVEWAWEWCWFGIELVADGLTTYVWKWQSDLGLSMDGLYSLVLD